MMTMDAGDDVPRGPAPAGGRGSAVARPLEPPAAGSAGPQRISGSAVPVGAAPDARAAPSMHRRRPSAQGPLPRGATSRPKGDDPLPRGAGEENAGRSEELSRFAGSGPPGAELRDRSKAFGGVRTAR